MNRQLLQEAHDAIEAFTDPQGHMPEDTGEFRDLSKVLVNLKAALSQPAPQGVAETMELAGNYAETRHRCGSHLYSTTSLAARGRVEQAITAIMQERDAHRAALDPAVAEIVKLKARVAELERDAARDAAMKQCGARLSNLAYNWAQHEGKTLTKADCNELNSLRHDWDASIASAKEPSHG